MALYSQPHIAVLAYAENLFPFDCIIDLPMELSTKKQCYVPSIYQCPY